MTRQGVIAISLGIAALGGGGYLLYAYKNCKWPFRNLERCKTPSPPPPPPPGVPAPPGQPQVVSVNAESPSSAKVTISWDPVQGAAYYRVIVDNQVAADNVQGNQYMLTLAPDRTYQIAVAACN